jgi:hypothetical protein
MKIIGWKLVAYWEDDTKEDVSLDMPYWVTKRIDNFLDELEEEDDESI